MMRKLMSTLLLILCLTSIVSAQDIPAIQNESAQAAWREDLRELYKKMQTQHPKLFWRTPEADFQKLVTELDKDIPTLTDDQKSQLAAMDKGFDPRKDITW